MSLILLNDNDVYGNIPNRYSSKRKIPESISRMASRCNTAVQSQVASKPQSHLSGASTPSRQAILRSGTTSPQLDLNKDDSDSDDKSSNQIE
jgi:hypothetical protein